MLKRKLKEYIDNQNLPKKPDSRKKQNLPKKQKVEVEAKAEFECTTCKIKITNNFFLDNEEQLAYCKNCNNPSKTVYIKKAKTNFGEKYCMWCNLKTKYGNFCYKHKRTIDTSNNKNIIKCLKCENEAKYAVKGELIPDHCLLHRENNEVNVYKIPCVIPSCVKSGKYGPSIDNMLHCHKHKTPEDTCSVHNTCLKCDVVASFGYLKNNKSEALYCVKHKEPDNICVRGHICICGKPASSKADRTNLHIYCRLCNPQIKHVICKEVGCDKIAIWGDPISKIIMFCEKHMKPGNIILNGRKTNIPICLFCNKKAIYGPENGPPEYCAKHFNDMKRTGKVNNYIKC